MNRNERTVFRPALGLRAVLGAFGVLCCVVAAFGWTSGRYASAGAMVILTALLLLPSFVGAAVVGRRIEIGNDGIRSISVFGSRTARWGKIERIDQGRGSFVIETEAGPISAGWIAPVDREALLRLVIERAKLTRVVEPSRFGLVAQYVPRMQDIGFVPHAKRRESMAGDSPEIKGEKQIPTE